MSRIRSVYLQDDEDEALERLASENHASINAVLRIALRRLAGLPVGSKWARDVGQSNVGQSKPN